MSFFIVLSCLVSIPIHISCYVPHIEKSRIFCVNSELGQAKGRTETDDVGEIYWTLNCVTVPFINTLLQAARFFGHARRVHCTIFRKPSIIYRNAPDPPSGKQHCLRVLLICSLPREQTEIKASLTLR